MGVAVATLPRLYGISLIFATRLISAGLFMEEGPTDAHEPAPDRIWRWIYQVDLFIEVTQ
jgi:hypothetical protein